MNPSLLGKRCHIFLFELFHKTLEAAVVIMKCEEEKTAEIGEISASEEEVLYYVSGYIVKLFSIG